MSAKDDELIGTVYRKIEREKQLINAAQAMMRSADSPAHKQSIESQIREAQRNRQYLEERMRELQTRKMNQGMEAMSLDNGAGSRQQGGPPPPPKDPNAMYGNDTYGSPPGGGDYSDQLGAGRGMMPPRPPFAGAPGTGPGGVPPKGRPQYSKLGRSHEQPRILSDELGLTLHYH
jgi:Hr1 repeat